MAEISLAALSYYQTGGSCQRLYQPKTETSLIASVQDIYNDCARTMIVGAGSNTLISDEFFPGAVISLASYDHIKVEGDSIRCGAGAINSVVAEHAYNAGLVGLGWMNGLPGQIGGTVRMNARCYGGEISQVASEVRTITDDAIVKTYHRSDEPFAGYPFRGYKDTVFMDNGELIFEAVLKLQKGSSEELAKERAHMDHCYADRKGKGQYDFPSCGCVFKNSHHVGVSSGMLLDAAGIKSLPTPPTVQVNPHHANFVFNTGGATSRDILEFTFMMRDAVYDQFGVWLEYEMEVLGDLPQDLALELARVAPEHLNEEALQPLREKFRQHLSSSKAK